MSRVFLMKWYHFSVEYFEDLRNVNHCEFLIMRKHEDSGKFILENKLRTWSELARERLLKEKSEKELSEEKAAKDAIPSPMSETTEGVAATPSVPKRKQWGGCPNGCDHGRFYYRRENGVASHNSSSNLAEAPPVRRAFQSRFQSSSEEDEDDPRGRLYSPLKSAAKSSSEENGAAKGKTVTGIQLSLDGMLLSEPTEAFVTDKLTTYRTKPRDKAVAAVLQAGRDFGGSASGHTSRATSDAEAEADTEGLGREGESGRRRTKSKREKKERGYKDSGMGRGARADALGDQSGDEEEGCEKCGSGPGNGNHQRRKDRAARAQASGDGKNGETASLFMGNLALDTTEDMLREAFGAQGTVMSVRLPTDS